MLYQRHDVKTAKCLFHVLLSAAVRETRNQIAPINLLYKGNVCDRLPSLNGLNHRGDLRWKKRCPKIFGHVTDRVAAACQGNWTTIRQHFCNEYFLLAWVFESGKTVPTHQNGNFFRFALWAQSTEQWATFWENMVSFLGFLADCNRKKTWLNPGVCFYITKIRIFFGFWRQKANFFGFGFNVSWWGM